MTGANSSLEGEVGDDDAEEEGWTDSAVKALIVVRHDMDDKFQTPKSRKTKICVLVAKKITKMTHNNNITGPPCDRKWKNLMQTLKQKPMHHQQELRVSKLHCVPKKLDHLTHHGNFVIS